LFGGYWHYYKETTERERERERKKETKRLKGRSSEQSAAGRTYYGGRSKEENATNDSYSFFFDLPTHLLSAFSIQRINK